MARRCQITQNGGWPSRTADKIRKSPAGCAIPEYQIGISPHLRVRSTTGRKTESAYFYSRAFRFATHYRVPQMSRSDSGKRSQGRSLCTPRSVVLPSRRTGPDIQRTPPVSVPPHLSSNSWGLDSKGGGRSPRPNPREGFPKGRAAALSFVSLGFRANRNALVLFFRGVGRVLFQKRMRPTSL